ncbi:hypothetical protein Clacol_004482 [Clathrus columnatus]|uniref:Uncharacterized protein n=1 Tax=Clathrus columnatus TaxID=1419009 RepID=A0AAV5AB54_9AGAM|nr:hypothetical protein Clacol_004482 [Clathrus columnatus]
MNPEISRHIRRLQVTKPQNITPLLWSYQLLARALSQMVNLKALEWSINTTPVFDPNSDIGKDYPNLRILKRQALVGDLISFCRWPNMRVLSLLIDLDRSKAPKKESIIEFIGFHSNIVSLEWNLRAIDGNKDSVRSVVLSPCIPPRPLKKIVGFPTDVEVWDHLESFKNICQSSLRIVVIPVKSIYQLTTFAAIFPNVESIDMRRNDLLRNSGNTPNTMEAILSSLSCLKRLRVILGIPLWEHDRPEEVKEDNKFFPWIHVLFPRLEFWGEPEDGVVFTRDGNNVSSWHWVRLPPATLYRFRDREQDFTIREECDRFAS